MRRAICIPLALAVLLVGCGGAVELAGAPTASSMPFTRSPAPAPPSVPTAPPIGDRTPAQLTAYTLVVTHASARHISFVDPVHGPVARVEVGAAPWDLAVAPNGLAYVSTAEGVAVVDVRRRERVALIPYRAAVGDPTFGEYRAGGMGIALAAGGRLIYSCVFVPDV